jgi:hypothetical protein
VIDTPSEDATESFRQTHQLVVQVGDA